MTFAKLFLILVLCLGVLDARLVLGQPAPLGTPLNNAQEAIASLAAPPADMATAVRQLRTDLAAEPVTGLDGRTTNLLAKLESLPEGVLSGAQKSRIFSALAEIYEMNLRLEASIPPGPGKGYQMVNWQHTRTEVNEIIDAMLKYNSTAATSGKPLLTPTQIEDAVLAGAFSDSVKLPPGANGNFFRHHLDGADAARKLAERYYPGDTARVEGLVTAIHEHQIVPPEFMGNLARHGMVGRRTAELVAQFGQQFPGELVDGKPNFESPNGRLLKGLIDKLNQATSITGNRTPIALTETEAALATRLGTAPGALGEFAEAVNGARDRIASPLTQPRTANGSRVAFSPEESAVLKSIGINEWILPQADAPHAKISEFVRIGDTAANYASSPNGLAKIIAIRGPGTPFDDHTVWDSVRSAEKSFNDALRVIPSEYHPALREMRGRTLTALRQTGAETRQWVNANKEAAGYAPDEPVLFWDKNATKQGLTPEKLAARTEFAKQIRSQFEGGLRAKQESWANVGTPAYDAEGLGAKMTPKPAAGKGAPEPAATPAGKPAAPVETVAVNEGPGGGRSLLGVNATTVKSAAAHGAKATVIGAGVGVALEAGRQLATNGAIDGKELWDNTLGNFNQFWKPLAGGTAGALAAGAVAARLLPGGGVLAGGLQFLGGSLGASAATGHLTSEPGKAVAGAVGSAVGAVAGGAALSWLLPPVGSFIGSTAGGIAGQIAGEWLYDRFKSPSKEVAQRPTLRGMTI